MTLRDLLEQIERASLHPTTMDLPLSVGLRALRHLPEGRVTGEILRSVSFDAWTAQRYPYALAPKVDA